MKKVLFLLMTVCCVAACTKHDFNYTYEDVQKQKFDQTFLTTFGTPATDHDWGFASANVVDLTQTASSRSVTRAANVNRNQWADNFVIPANVTPQEIALVTAEFSKQRVGAVNDVNVNWTDYFIYEVYKGESVYKDGFGQDVLGSDHMNHLQVKYGDADIAPANNEAWEHANDFNNGDHSATWGTIEGATLMVNSGTKDFAYHNSTDSKYHTEYIIIPGESIDASLAGYYYIGFDFCASHPDSQEANKNMDVERDWRFSDWILRISPATFKNAKMIIAEDLAASESDFDYNDVVFTATLANEWVGSLNANKLVAHITLLAAGGTIPLTVAGREVHELFGVPVSTMVNTGLVTKPNVQFTAIIGDADWSGQKNIKDIPVIVKTDNGVIELTSNVGEPSEKLCVDVDYEWCAERQPIQNKYPDFQRWVSDRTYQNWYQVK